MILKQLIIIALISAALQPQLFSTTSQIEQSVIQQDEIMNYCNANRDVIKDYNGKAILFDHLDQCFYMVDSKTKTLILWSGIYNLHGKRNRILPPFLTVEPSSPERNVEQEITEQLKLIASEEANFFYFYKENFKFHGSFNSEKTVFTISMIEEITQEPKNFLEKLRKRASSLSSNGSNGTKN